MNILINQTPFPGCFEIILPFHTDERGDFVKIFHEDAFRQRGLETHFPEEYYSLTRQGVLRGMHFQLPPHDHIKLVCCPYGEIFDAVVDLRVGSPTYGQYATFDINPKIAKLLYIPSGLAHGFYVLSESAFVLYKVSTVYSPDHDTGILWNSANIPWPDTNPIISARDKAFPPLSNFKSLFVFQKEKL